MARSKLFLFLLACQIVSKVGYKARVPEPYSRDSRSKGPDFAGTLSQIMDHGDRAMASFYGSVGEKLCQSYCAARDACVECGKTTFGFIALSDPAAKTTQRQLASVPSPSATGAFSGNATKARTGATNASQITRGPTGRAINASEVTKAPTRQVTKAPTRKVTKAPTRKATKAPSTTRAPTKQERYSLQNALSHNNSSKPFVILPRSQCNVSAPQQLVWNNHSFSMGFIIGPQKTGTSFLHGVLRSLEDVLGPTNKLKETHFQRFPMEYPDLETFLQKCFLRKDGDHEYRIRRMAIYRPEPPLTIYDDRLYLDGSATAFFDSAFDMVQNTFGVKDPKYVMILRDPTKRLISHINHVIQHHLNESDFRSFRGIWQNETTLNETKVDAFLREMLEKDPFTFVQLGVYASTLKLWLQNIPCESLFIVDNAHISNPSVLLEMMRFLGLKERSLEELQEIVDFFTYSFEEHEKRNAYKEFRYLKLPANLSRRVEEFYAPHNEALWSLLNISADDTWF